MQLTILGSGTFIPTAKRNTSCYLLDIGKEVLLLDSGSGCIRQMCHVSRSFLEVNRIFYSHLHLDHIADFLPILFSRKYSKPQRPTGALIIHAHQDFAYYYNQLTKIFKRWVIEPEYPSLFEPLAPGVYDFRGYTLKVYRSNHTPESLMYRFEEQGKGFLYTGDVDLCPELYEAAKEVDWLLIECGNTNDNPASGHMNPNKIKRLIETSNPKQVILTHIPPELEEMNIRDTFGADYTSRIHLAHDLQQFTLQ